LQINDDFLLVIKRDSKKVSILKKGENIKELKEKPTNILFIGTKPITPFQPNKYNRSTIIQIKDNGEIIIDPGIFSIYPVYYKKQNDIILISTKIRYLYDPPLELDLVGIYQFFLFGHPLGNHTFVKNIKICEPGRRTVIKTDNSIDHQKYFNWTFEFIERDEQELVSEISRTLDEELNSFYNANDDLILSLSGGLDSGLLLTYFVKNGFSNKKNLIAITTGVKNCTEMKLATKRASQFRIKHIKIPLTHKFLETHAEEFVEATGGMLGLNHIHNLVIPRSIHFPKSYKIVYGYFGDEPFGEHIYFKLYDFFQNPFLIKKLLKLKKRYYNKTISELKELLAPTKYKARLFDFDQLHRRFLPCFTLCGEYYEYCFPLANIKIIDKLLLLEKKYLQLRRLEKNLILYKTSGLKTNLLSRIKKKIFQLMKGFEYAFHKKIRRTLIRITKGKVRYYHSSIEQPYEDWIVKNIEFYLNKLRSLPKFMFDFNIISNIILRHLKGEDFTILLMKLTTFSIWWNKYCSDIKSQEILPD